MATAGYSFDFKSSSSADGKSQAAFDNSGFVVNVGGKGGVSAVPSWAIVASVALAAWWVWKHH